MKPSTFENNTSITDEHATGEENIEDKALQEQLAIDLELQFADIRQGINHMHVAENNSAVATAK